LSERYFAWLCNLIKKGTPIAVDQYTKLLKYLHDVEFAYILDMDGNRYEDGISIRYRFGYEMHIDAAIIASEIDVGKCSMLEMMCALSLKCEEHIMSDPDIGDRTGKWFWDMIISLGLSDMTDSRFSKSYVDDVIYIFLHRKYKPTGEGGLFTVPNIDRDFRRIELWEQMMHYLNYIKN